MAPLVKVKRPSIWHDGEGRWHPHMAFSAMVPTPSFSQSDQECLVEGILTTSASKQKVSLVSVNRHDLQILQC